MFFFNFKASKCLGYLFLIQLNTYVIGLRPFKIFYSFSVWPVFIHQNLMSTDIRLWRIKTVPALKGLKYMLTQCRTTKALEKIKLGLCDNFFFPTPLITNPAHNVRWNQNRSDIVKICGGNDQNILVFKLDNVIKLVMRSNLIIQVYKYDFQLHNTICIKVHVKLSKSDLWKIFYYHSFLQRRKDTGFEKSQLNSGPALDVCWPQFYILLHR